MFKRSRKKIILAIMGSLILLFAITLSVIMLASYREIRRENMDMLKEELFYKSAELFSDHMLGSRTKGKPVYLSMGMAYIEMACKEKHLFKLIADIDEYETEDLHEFLQQGDCNELLEKLPSTENLSPEKKKEVFKMVWMFTHGVAALVTSKRVSMETEEIEDMLKRAYEGFVHSAQS